MVRIRAQDNLENRDPGTGEPREQRPAEQRRLSWSSEAGPTHTEDSRGLPGPPAQMERWRDARGRHPRVGSAGRVSDPHEVAAQGSERRLQAPDSEKG